MNFNISVKAELNCNSVCLTMSRDGDWHQGWVWVDFLQSITMPTYLVAFAVHDFGSVSAPSAPNQVSFKVKI